VSRERLTVLGERKALLVTRAHLDRARMTLALHEIRAIVAPAPDAVRVAALRRTAAVMLGVAVPLLGRTRLARWLRAASLAMAAYRIARSWRGAR
jgi:hypothetical protein